MSRSFLLGGPAAFVVVMMALRGRHVIQVVLRRKSGVRMTIFDGSRPICSFQ